jgi:hypothetical protein
MNARRGRQALDEAVIKLGLWAGAVVAGNAALMALLTRTPFADPAAQLAAGAAAMALHGWGAWALGSGLWAWGKASSALGQIAAREAVGEVVHALRREKAAPPS